jgi:hypothetical protein
MTVEGDVTHIILPARVICEFVLTHGGTAPPSKYAGNPAMSEAHTIWHDMPARRNAAVTRQWTGVVLAAVLLTAMCGAEVLFLKYVAGPDTVNLLTAAEGMAVTSGD